MLLAAAQHSAVYGFGGIDPRLRMLRYLWLGAYVPVLPLACHPAWAPQVLMPPGAALAPLADEGVWLLISVSITHKPHLFMFNLQPKDIP